VRNDVRVLILAGSILFVLGETHDADARNPFRRAFFDRYPNAVGSALDDLPSNGGHCGVCHFDFAGGGQRNPYGVALEARLKLGLSAAQAILEVEADDTDNDGFSNLVEASDVEHFGNTPTFPGLTERNYLAALNVDTAEVAPHLTPAGAADTDPPVVTVTAPAGGESLPAESRFSVQWNAADASGIGAVAIDISDDGGLHWRRLEQGLPDAGSHDLFVPHLPGNAMLRVVATDNAGNQGSGQSGTFGITARTTGIAPTTLRDFDLPGTQPFGAGIAEDPAQTCIACHGDYDPAVEHWSNWQGSMMAQAMRDPLYLATLQVAESVAPSVGDLCLRCHTPNGWAEGRSIDTSANSLVAKDFQGVQCDFCHNMVDPVYVEGVSPPRDQDVLAGLERIPPTAANGMFVLDADPVLRGPYADAAAVHQFQHSPFHLSSDLCATCHDVSNPVFVKGVGDGTYEVQALDTPHPDGDPRNMFPIERTYSEWSRSAYAVGGVYQPQFAGDRPDGMVSSCQDCHLRDVTGVGAAVATAPTRSDLGLHDMTGGNTFLPDILPVFYPGEVDPVELQAGKLRAESMLTLAATLQVTSDNRDGLLGINVRVVNETAHKLPSGYPEGRRAWLNVKAFDAGDQVIYESAAYDPDTGVLGHDDGAKIYEIKPGISTRLGALLGVEPGPSFHFALNDTVYSDNRIPPRGFTNAAFTEIQSPPVGYAYADGDHWDDTHYVLPSGAVRVEVALYYQTTSKEYIEFLRDNNSVSTLGQELYDAWAAHGRSAPVAMAQQSLTLDLSAAGDDLPRVTSLAQNYPNPFNPQTFIEFALPRAGRVTLRIYDGRGRLVRTLVDEVRGAGPHRVRWDGADDGGRAAASGVYHYVLKTADGDLQRKMTLLR
jgi:hypothetical protein